MYRPVRLRAGLGVIGRQVLASGSAELAFVVGKHYSLARARGHVVGIEVAHHAAVKMQTHCSRPLVRHTSNVNVVRVRDEARDSAAAEQDYSASHQLDVYISVAVWRQPYVTSFFEYALDYSDDPPATVVMHGRPLTWQPNQRVKRQAFIWRVVDEIAGVAVWIAPVVLRPKKHLGFFDQIQHEWCKRKYAICWIGEVAAACRGLRDESFEGGCLHDFPMGRVNAQSRNGGWHWDSGRVDAVRIHDTKRLS